MIHSDIGTGIDEEDEATQIWLAPLMPRLLAPGGLVISGFALHESCLASLPLPGEVEEGRYFFYRRA